MVSLHPLWKSALRKFFLRVHPDRFFGVPALRTVNEESLKSLNGALQMVDRLPPGRNTSATTPLDSTSKGKGDRSSGYFPSLEPVHLNLRFHCQGGQDNGPVTELRVDRMVIPHHFGSTVSVQGAGLKASVLAEVSRLVLNCPDLPLTPDEKEALKELERGEERIHAHGSSTTSSTSSLQCLEDEVQSLLKKYFQSSDPLAKRKLQDPETVDWDTVLTWMLHNDRILFHDVPAVQQDTALTFLRQHLKDLRFAVWKELVLVFSSDLERSRRALPYSLVVSPTCSLHDFQSMLHVHLESTLLLWQEHQESLRKLHSLVEDTTRLLCLQHIHVETSPEEAYLFVVVVTSSLPPPMLLW